MKITDEVVLPIRVEKNARPPLNPGGDCGACVMAALLHTCPREVYDILDGVRPLTFVDMKSLSEKLKAAKRVDRSAFHLPHFSDRASFWRFFGDESAWYDLVHVHLEAGYYGVSTVDNSRTGQKHDTMSNALLDDLDPILRENPELMRRFDFGHAQTNHWLLVCGAALVDGVPSVMISDSSRRTQTVEEWVTVQHFIERMNGLKIGFIKPATRRGILFRDVFPELKEASHVGT